MIGRQGLRCDPVLLKQLFTAFRIPFSNMDGLAVKGNGYAEPLLEMLGAKEIVSIDASAYEGCSIVHDMNQPISEHLKARFDLVLDSGSLEHVFNFPVAIKNCMEMVRLGGYLVTMNPANNCPGHGFYQFSPELFFRVLSETNEL
jgi:2-polyprenyl-3-methyl-5-hydroxy-6-metoxy-1,4-benzoquinol methylase